jgi:HEAT repeat protein
VALKIEALSASDPLKGLDTYERWLGSRTDEDLGLLEPVARGVLTALASSNDQVIRNAALQQLAASGISSAREAMAATAQGGASLDATLADVGDAQAIERLKTAAAAPGNDDKSAVARGLASAGEAGVPGLLRLMRSQNLPTRIAAITSLGKLRAKEAQQPLQAALTDSDPVVRATAAVALARLGDATGQAEVDKMLGSEIPDLQLLAAGAWDGESGPWVGAIRPLLDNRDGLIRFQAARLIAPVDPDAARQVLNEGLADPNPVVRTESAHQLAEVVEAHPEILDPARLRQLLRLPDPMLRLRAASALLAAERGRTAA